MITSAIPSTNLDLIGQRGKSDTEQRCGCYTYLSEHALVERYQLSDRGGREGTGGLSSPARGRSGLPVGFLGVLQDPTSTHSHTYMEEPMGSEEEEVTDT